MVREELVTGIQNAVIRGESIEQAMQTLIFSGYDPKDVQEAADALNMGVLNQLPKKIEESQEIKKAIAENRPQQIPVQQPKEPPKTSEQPLKQNEYLALSQPTPQTQEVKPKRRLSRGFIILMIILLVLIMGIVAFSIFGPKILESIFPKTKA